MLTVGLTGGIASGKSHVTAILQELGCNCIDADQIARLVVEPGQPAYDEIVSEFGQDILQEDGTLDRARLGTIVFSNEDRRLRLNAIVHPRVHDYQQKWLESVAASNPQAIAIIDAALMIESGGYRKFDKLVVVHCSKQAQLERLMKRNGLSKDEALKRIASQMPAEEKLKLADFAIDTSGSLEDTRAQVIALFETLRSLEAGKTKQGN